MKLDNAIVLITGANRGIGLAFAKAALARGARKVYAGARDPSRVKLPCVTPIRLDVNSPADVAAAAEAARDVTVVINNAGIAQFSGQKTQVLTLHMAFVDTDMTQGIALPKSTPEAIVARALDALEAGADEVLADEMTQQVKLGLSAHPGVYLQPRE